MTTEPYDIFEYNLIDSSLIFDKTVRFFCFSVFFYFLFFLERKRNIDVSLQRGVRKKEQGKGKKGREKRKEKEKKEKRKENGLSLKRI